ncbi:uncharacterized protein LOC116251317 [Nymphaea colorata]|nr:uncharacterized protein LOC116251317 [Nymphaea colorata]
MVSGSKQKPSKREPLDAGQEPANPTIKIDSERLLEGVSPQSEGYPLAIMGEEGEEEVLLRRSCALSLEEVIRRRSNRVKRLSRVYRKQYWALLEEVRFRYREYYWKFGRSGVKEEEEEERADNGGSGFLVGCENGNYGVPGSGFTARIGEGGSGFLEGEGDGGVGFVERLGQDCGGFQDRNGENGFEFPGNSFPASMDSRFLGETGDNGFRIPENVFPAKMGRDGCGFSATSKENHFGYPDCSFPSRMGQDGCGFLGGNEEDRFGFPDSGFVVKGGQAARAVVKTEECNIGFAESGFQMKTRKDLYGLSGKHSENGYGFSASGFPGKAAQEGRMFSAKYGENGFSAPEGSFTVKTFQEDSVPPTKSGENGVPCPVNKVSDKAGDNKCGFSGCKMKPMALSVFCHSHILSDSKQQLYKACTYVIKSGQTGPITCGKPVLRAAVPCLCFIHFQKAQKHVARSLKKAGLAASSSNKPAPKLHVIISEYVRCIQAKRKDMDNGSRIQIRDSSLTITNTVKDEAVE